MMRTACGWWASYSLCLFLLRSPFAFTYLRLADSSTGVALSDGRVDLPCFYPILPEMDADDCTIVPTYLPHGKFGPASEPPKERPRDVLSVEIHLLSADKSSNADLHALRNWARQGGQSLAAVLDRLCQWGSLELARHLRMV
jgi:hypothetical protein